MCQVSLIVAFIIKHFLTLFHSEEFKENLKLFSLNNPGNRHSLYQMTIFVSLFKLKIKL